MPTVAHYVSRAFLVRERKLVGLGRFELPTPRLSSVCSNQLSYRPLYPKLDPLASLLTARTQDPVSLTKVSKNLGPSLVPSKLDRHALTKPSLVCQIDLSNSALTIGPEDRSDNTGSRKEVIQPQVLLQLPCYDFTPITDHTLGTCLPCGLAKLLLVQPAFVM